MRQGMEYKGKKYHKVAYAEWNSDRMSLACSFTCTHSNLLVAFLHYLGPFFLCFVPFLTFPTSIRNREPDLALRGASSEEFFRLLAGRSSLPSDEDGFLFNPAPSWAHPQLKTGHQR